MSATMQFRWVCLLGCVLLWTPGCDGSSGDGNVDFDGDIAFDDAGRPLIPGMCSEPAAVACATSAFGDVPMMLTGTTVGGADGFGGSSCSAEGGATGGTGVNDIAFRFTAQVASAYNISTVGSSFDTVLSIRNGCGGEELGCNDDIMGGNVQSALTVMLTACQTIVIVVDGYDPEATGTVALRISRPESLCSDGNDNDGDGLSDCADSDCLSVACEWETSWQNFETRALELTNDNRAAGATCADDTFAPAPALEMDELLRQSARGHSLDMGQRNYFEHVSPDGGTMTQRIQATGFTGDGPWGENIATGQTSPEQVVAGWMDSPGHCRNIMNPDYRVIGFGYAYVEGGGLGHFWTQNFAGSHSP